MALAALTLSVTQGVQGRPFQAKINGLTTGRVEVLNDGAPGFSVVNGNVMSSGLPYPVSTVVLREYEPGASPSFRDSRIDITAATRDSLRAQALASVSPRALVSFRVAGTRQPDGSIVYAVYAQDDLGATLQTAAGGGAPTPTPGLPAFAYQAETLSVASAMTTAGSAPSGRLQKSLDRFISRLKAAGLYSAGLYAYFVMDSEAQFRVNLFDPTKTLGKVGSPTFTANNNVRTTAATAYYDTGVPLSAIDANNCAFYCYPANVLPAETQSDFGAIDNSLGVSMVVQSATNGVSGRLMGASTALGTSGQWGLAGLHGMSRTSGTEFAAGAHGVRQVTSATTSAPINSAVTIGLLKANGASQHTTRPHRAFLGFKRGLTEAEELQLQAIVTDFIERIRFGHTDEYPAGTAPQNVTAYDVVVYGATAQGVCAAYEAARQGKSVCIVGGWRDRRLGGMTSGGLGYIDYISNVAVLGLSRWMVRRANELGGASNTLVVEPRHVTRAIYEMLDPLRTNGRDVPVFWSDGIASATMNGKRIASITTVDGRTFTGKYFVEAGFEGDLMAAAGVPFIIGREAAGLNAESINGWRTVAGSLATNVDPYVTEGVPGSGLLPYVQTDPGLAAGAADNRTQDYNFRLIMTTDDRRSLVPANVAPAGYSKANYEVLLRQLALNPSWTFIDVVKPEVIAVNVYDVNNRGAISTDAPGSGSMYANAATYAQREVAWKFVENWMRGLIYLLAYDTDPRIPAAVKTGALSGYNLDTLHFPDPHPNDQAFWPHQLYVREHRRRAGLAPIWNGRDLDGVDGSVPRLTTTVSTCTYRRDSHKTGFYLNGATGKLGTEGGFEADSGGADSISPLPAEIFMADKSECENLWLSFVNGSTHVANSVIRMEMPSMQAAQSGACYIALAMEAGNIALQDVAYATARTRILATPTLTGESAPNLPQVN